MGRRLKFAILVIVSQMLLIALAIAWVVHMVIIATNGAVYFVETNPVILWAEIAAVALIALFATAVFAIQLYRLSERRTGDNRRSSDEGRKREDRRTINELEKQQVRIWTPTEPGDAVGIETPGIRGIEDWPTA